MSRATRPWTGPPGAPAEFVDLYDVVKAHFFGAGGLGLKLIAQHAGFRWRDEDPGGLNSQAWFADAVRRARRGGPRAGRATRVLEYNEDDVLATAVLRAWLRSPLTAVLSVRRWPRSTTASTSSTPDRRLARATSASSSVVRTRW